MDIPFVFGKVADGLNFTDRQEDTDNLVNNLLGLVNTIIISPRRWGKTSLVHHALETIKEEKEYLTCQVDIFNCRTEAQFYQAYINAILKASFTKMDEFMLAAKKYVGLSSDEILDLPQKIAEEKGKKFIVCIDEFQNVNIYDDPIGFQRKLRSHWQRHNRVGYCMFGSKRHMLLDIFSNYEMPFYKFGHLLFLEKIKEEEWVKFIVKRFEDTGKTIDNELARDIARRVECHPYYVQQLAQLVWLRTAQTCETSLIASAFESLVGQLSLLFSNMVDTLTAKQINFLLAVAHRERNFSSRDVLERYQLGTSANIKNLKKALLDNDLIDILPDSIQLQDPLFSYWLKSHF